MRRKDSQNMRNPRVLVADDERIVRDLFRRSLGKQGYEVSTARDGLDALNKIKRNNYDVVILDLKMPRMEGMELVKKTRQMKKDLIIIIITGYASVDTAKEAIKQGCFDYITKPFNIGDVKILIKRAFTMREMADEKKRLEQQLIRSEKLASLGRMSLGVAHEIRNPLSIILTGSELLEGKFSKADKETKETLAIIKEAVLRADKIIKGLSAFSRPSRLQLEHSNVNNIINKTLPLIEHQMSVRNIKIRKDLLRNIPEINIDRNQIQQVLINILLNSCQAMPEGGEVKIKTYRKTISKIGWKDGRSSSDYFELGDRAIIIEIEDTGRGIPEEHLTKIVDPFFTTKRSEKNAGLGLSICQTIIDNHRGTIQIESKLKKGTKVMITFPSTQPRQGDRYD